MEVLICADESAVGALAAAAIAQVVRAKPDATLGVATGASPMAVYAGLARLAAETGLDLTGTSAFALDEYVGLPVGHEQSYAEVIRTTVTEPLGLDPSRVHTPDGNAADLQAAGPAYEALIASAGGVDIQLLGIGRNGHIGFNEPTSSLGSPTRIKTLTEQTRADNRRFFESAEEVPHHCLTMGLGTIMRARSIVLVAQGAHKAEAIAAAVEGPVTAMVPASILQLHPDVTIIVDEAAATRLALASYYRETAHNKPLWQRLPVDIPPNPAR